MDRHGHWRAFIANGTLLVPLSRQPVLDAARVLIRAGYPPAAWIEGWHPGASEFAMRARLGEAARLSVDETRTIFVQWKPFPSSAVGSPKRFSETAATLAAEQETATSSAPDEQDPPDKRRRPHTGNARALSFPDKAAAGANCARTLPTSSREEKKPAGLSNGSSALTR